MSGWVIHHLSEQPVPVPHSPPILLKKKKSLPYIQSKSPLFYFETISPFPVTTDPAKELVVFLLVNLF